MQCVAFSLPCVFWSPIGFLVYWLLAQVSESSVANFNLPWLVGILGLIFAPGPY